MISLAGFVVVVVVVVVAAVVVVVEVVVVDVVVLGVGEAGGAFLVEALAFA